MPLASLFISCASFLSSVTQFTHFRCIYIYIYIQVFHSRLYPLVVSVLSTDRLSIKNIKYFNMEDRAKVQWQEKSKECGRYEEEKDKKRILCSCLRVWGKIASVGRGRNERIASWVQSKEKVKGDGDKEMLEVTRREGCKSKGELTTLSPSWLNYLCCGRVYLPRTGVFLLQQFLLQQHFPTPFTSSRVLVFCVVLLDTLPPLPSSSYTLEGGHTWLALFSTCHPLRYSKATFFNRPQCYFILYLF